MADGGDNEAERRRWNDEYWAAAWPRREQLTGAVTDLLLEHLELSPGERVLDIGSGGGTAALAAAPLVGATGLVVGADISVPLVAFAKRRASDRGVENVEFIEADVQQEAIAGGPFNVAMSQFGVMFFDRPDAAFANIRAQVEPGGRLGFACWQATEQNPWFIGPALAPFLGPSPAAAPGKSPTGPFSFADEARTTGILVASGWSEIVRTGYELTVQVDRDAVFDDAQLTFLGVPDRDLEPAREAVERHLGALRRNDGRYDAPLAFQIFTAAS